MCALPQDTPSMTIAHISSTLIRNRIPGHHPSPLVRSRDTLRLLELALHEAVSHKADAIVMTGSIISAPPPLRVCDANFYYPVDRSVSITEAEADYCSIRALLEDCKLPYVVTPGKNPLDPQSPGRISMPLLVGRHHPAPHRLHPPRAISQRRRRRVSAPPPPPAPLAAGSFAYGLAQERRPAAVLRGFAPPRHRPSHRRKPASLPVHPGPTRLNPARPG